MRAHFALLVFLAFGGIGRAETLDSAKIEELLDDTTVYGLPLAPDSWRQSFSKGGETIYIDASGAKTFGSWLVRGNKYCSIWPPSDRAVCYEMESGETSDGKPMVTWISGGDGKRYEALLVKGLRVDEPTPLK